MKNIILGVVSVVALASIIYFASSFKKVPEEIASVKKTSIESLLMMGGSQKCTYSAEISGVTTSGTIYVNNGNMRADSKVVMQDKDVDSHIILLKDTSYVWGAGMAQGFTMDIKKFKEQGVKQPTSAQSFDMKKEINYSCQPWSYDATVFALPANITFTDMSQMMQVKTGTSPTINNQVNGASISCDACNSVPTSARAQCKAALNCK